MQNRECRSPRFRSAYLALICVCVTLLAACGHSTATFIAKGEEYLKKRKFHDALMQFRSAVEADADSSAAHWGLARAQENLGQFNETVDELRKTVELDETNLEAKAKLGNYFLLVQPPMIAEAQTLRDEILAANESFIEGQILTASIMAAQGKPDVDVIRQINKAIDLDPARVESYISLERLYMTRDNAEGAEQAILRGVKANPAAPQGYTEYGRFLMYVSRDHEAEEQFKKAIDVDAASIEAREAIGEFYVTSRQLEKAEQTYRELVALQENSPESRLVLAEFYGKNDRRDEAIETLTAIVAETPEYVLARYRLADLYLARRETRLVEEQLKALFEINDDDIEALMLRARLYIQDGRVEDGVKDLEEVLKQTPTGREALFLTSQARLAMGQIERANAFIGDLERYHPAYLKTGLLKIQAAFTTGDPSSALKLSNELISRVNATVPNADNSTEVLQDLRVRALSSRGLASLDLGRSVDARNDLEEVLRLSPRSSSAMVNLAKVRIADQQLHEALGLYERSIAADPANFDGVSGMVNTCIRLGDTKKAHERLGELAAASSGKPAVLAALRYLTSTVFSAEHNAPAAEAELRAAIALDENYLPAYSAYASLLSAQNRGDEALQQYRRVVEKRPSAQAYTMIGILEDGRGNGSEAEASYRKALEIAPETPIAANNLAWLIADRQGNLDEALRLAQMAVTRNQTVAGYYDTLGWIYLQRGLALPAVEQLKKAVAIEENNARTSGGTPNPGYRVRLGMALARAGDKMSARREVELSLRNINVLTQREVKDAKSVLASL